MRLGLFLANAGAMSNSDFWIVGEQSGRVHRAFLDDEPIEEYCGMETSLGDLNNLWIRLSVGVNNPVFQTSHHLGNGPANILSFRRLVK